VLPEKVDKGEHGSLGRPLKGGVVDVLKAESGAQTTAPLKVVVDAPRDGTGDVDTVDDLGLEKRVEVGGKVVDAQLVVQGVLEGGEVVLKGLGEAKFRQNNVFALWSGVRLLEVVEEVSQARGVGLEP